MRSHQSLWLWLGGVLATVATVAAGAAVAFESTQREYPFWTSVPMIIGYATWILAAGCFLAAVRGWSFPGVVEQGVRPPVDTEIEATFTYERDWIPRCLSVGIANHGRTLPAATVNVLVPATFNYISRIDRHTRDTARGDELETPESLIRDGGPSVYWAETDLRLPGRVSTLLAFVLGAQPLKGTYPVRLKVIADELREDAIIDGTFEV